MRVSGIEKSVTGKKKYKRENRRKKKKYRCERKRQQSVGINVVIMGKQIMMKLLRPPLPCLRILIKRYVCVTTTCLIIMYVAYLCLSPRISSASTLKHHRRTRSFIAKCHAYHALAYKTARRRRAAPAHRVNMKTRTAHKNIWRVRRRAASWRRRGI